MDPKKLERGPFRADQLKSGDPYELSNGHAILCLPSGGLHAQALERGGMVIRTDPLGHESATDAGFSPEPGTLRAPDISVGNVTNTPGWLPGVPKLAIEYASTGQDEEQLAQKIDDLLTHGTQWVWVVRLVGPHRVEIYEPQKALRVLGIDAILEAPGVLQNPLPVRALFDDQVAQQTALSNILSQYGYQNLNQVREEGEAKGREEGEAKGREEGEHALAAAIVDLCEALSIEVSEAQRQSLQSMRLSELDRLRVQLKTERVWIASTETPITRD